MNTTLKPSVSPQSSSVPNQLNKPMHPQGTPTYNQPSGHMSQNPYPNINAAHNHPNAQQNHFSLNVPNATSHFAMGTIPASNHPVANMSQSAAGQQIFNQQKSSSYSSSYQPNLGHPPNPNAIPPVCQTLPATPQVQSQQSQSNSSPQKTSSSPATATNTSTPDIPSPEKPHSNGTAEVKTPTKLEGQSNHVSPSSSLPSQIPQASAVPAQQPEKLPEKAKTQLTQEQKPPPSEPAKPVVEASSPPTRAAPVITEQDQTNVESKVCKPVEIEVKDQENKEVESTETSSVSPMETDPLATDKEEISSNSEAEQTLNSAEKIEHQASSAGGQNQEETSEHSQEKHSNEAVQETEPMDQTVASKSNEPETPIKATVSRAVRKPKTPKTDSSKSTKSEPKTPVQKSPSTGKIKRQRTATQHYQSPLPEIESITKMSSSTPRNKNNDDKLIYFYKNEFLAVRNAEGGFYLCQAIQNIYRSSLKIKIRWLSQDKTDKTGEIYTPDFYDLTDFDCILTSLDLDRVDKGKYRLTKAEKERTDSILKRCLAVEKGEITNPSVSEEHPDGLDLSLYKDEEQLKKRKGTKRKSTSHSSKKQTPTKKSPDAPKVQKIDVAPPKKATPVSKKPPPKKVVPAESKKPATPSRAAKGKRKSDTKTSPVVDQKKARVLAKIGRKTAIPASTKPSQPAPSKSVKLAKPIPSTSKAPVKPPVNLKASTSTRNSKRSTRK